MVRSCCPRDRPRPKEPGGTWCHGPTLRRPHGSRTRTGERSLGYPGKRNAGVDQARVLRPSSSSISTVGSPPSAHFGSSGAPSRPNYRVLALTDRVGLPLGTSLAGTHACRGRRPARTSAPNGRQLDHCWRSNVAPIDPNGVGPAKALRRPASAPDGRCSKASQWSEQ